MSHPPGLLLVEGRSDADMVRDLCKQVGIPDTLFDVEVMRDSTRQGSQEPAPILRSHLKLGQRSRIAVLVDADLDAARTWQPLRDLLRREGCSAAPDTPRPGGFVGDLLVLGSEPTRVGVWIMPNNDGPGMLEDFLLGLVTEGDCLLPMADQALAQLRASVAERNAAGERVRFRDAHLAKARLQTWLAWQPEPGTSTRLAFTRKYLTVGTSSARDFESWLRQMYEALLATA